jgi:hypothetical protein
MISKGLIRELTQRPYRMSCVLVWNGVFIFEGIGKMLLVDQHEEKIGGYGNANGNND